MLETDARVPRTFGAAQIHANNLHAWRGPAMLILDNHGRAGDDDVSGLYFREARYLRTLSLELFGESPHLCSVVQPDANLLEFSLIYPERKGGGSDRGGDKNGVRYRNLDIRLTYEAQPNGLLATVRITNRWMDHVLIDVRWQLAADFADFDELEVERKQHAETGATPITGGVRFRYMHPQLSLATHVVAEGGGDWSFSDGSLATRVELTRHAEQVFRLRVTAVDAEEPIDQQECSSAMSICAVTSKHSPLFRLLALPCWLKQQLVRCTTLHQWPTWTAAKRMVGTRGRNPALPCILGP
jgi:hypothetical protein